MNEKAKQLWLNQDATKKNATRFADADDRLKYDVKFVNRYIPNGGCVLDLCCGTGMMTVEMAKKASKVYAVDFNPEFLNQIPDNDKITKVTSDASEFYEDTTFDVITIFGAIQYNVGDDVKKIYHNCFRMLKEGGVLIVSGQWGIHERVTVDKFSEELQKTYFAEYRTTNEETKLLRSIGFNTEVIEILPEKFNHYSNTHFYGIVATKKTAADNLVPTPQYKDTIGIIGGMGSFATLDFFHRLLNAFPGKKEWDRPRIIIDNRCTMPSRVRAILYNENYDYVLSCLIESTENLIKCGADILILACNTSHVFLDDIIKAVPEAESRFINIIDSLGKQLMSEEEEERSYRLLASEGTIESNIYQNYLQNYHVNIHAPSKEEYSLLREVIEDVKQDLITARTITVFKSLIERNPDNKKIIIGCTEFPPVYRLIQDYLESEGYQIYDPLETAIGEIKRRIRKN